MSNLSKLVQRMVMKSSQMFNKTNYFTLNSSISVKITTDVTTKMLTLNFYSISREIIMYLSSFDFKPKFDLTLRRPLRKSWRLGVFSGSHGWALAAIPKRWKNIPHKSSTADFLKLFIFMQDACWTHKTRLKI